MVQSGRFNLSLLTGPRAARSVPASFRRKEEMKRALLAIVCVALASPALASKSPRIPPHVVVGGPTTVTIASSPLTIVVGSDTSAQVYNSNVPGTGQFYPPDCGPGETADNGVFASLSGIVYGPDFANHPCGSASNIVYALDARLHDARHRNGDGRRSLHRRDRGGRRYDGAAAHRDADLHRRPAPVQHVARLLERRERGPHVGHVHRLGPLPGRQRRGLCRPARHGGRWTRSQRRAVLHSST